LLGLWLSSRPLFPRGKAGLWRLLGEPRENAKAVNQDKRREGGDHEMCNA